MLTLAGGACMGDFELSITVAPPGVPFPFKSAIPQSKPRHVAAEAARILGRPAYSVLEYVGFGTLRQVNGYRRWLAGDCTAEDVLQHLSSGQNGARINACACYGQPAAPPPGSSTLDAASRALVEVLQKYGTLQEAVAPGCGVPIASVLAAWTPDGNDHDVEVLTSEGTRLSVFCCTS
jgi:hypothetical protein